MNTVRVKICGITQKLDLEAAAAAGADALGFVVGIASSPRNLSLEKAEKLFRQVPPFVKSVLVTVPIDINDLAETCRKLNPDVIQLHGKNLFAVNSIREKLPSTPMIRVVNANSPDALEVARVAGKIFDAVLLDSISDGQYGGTGVVHDWTLSKRIRHAIQPTPLILAGGLNPENVAKAVRLVQPYAVDVSSGVELQPAIKDNQKIFNFIKNARSVRT